MATESVTNDYTAGVDYVERHGERVAGTGLGLRLAQLERTAQGLGGVLDILRADFNQLNGGQEPGEEVTLPIGVREALHEAAGQLRERMTDTLNTIHESMERDVQRKKGDMTDTEGFVTVKVFDPKGMLAVGGNRK